LCFEKKFLVCRRWTSILAKEIERPVIIWPDVDEHEAYEGASF
jgi:hypothetical protein